MLSPFNLKHYETRQFKKKYRHNHLDDICGINCIIILPIMKTYIYIKTDKEREAFYVEGEFDARSFMQAMKRKLETIIMPQPITKNKLYGELIIHSIDLSTTIKFNGTADIDDIKSKIRTYTDKFKSSKTKNPL